MNETPDAVATRPPTLRYLPGLDGLRAVSVLAVLVFHHYFVFGAQRGWLPGGFLGVEVFFVVSGYLITSLLLSERRDTGSVSLKQFWFRRARRLLPAVLTLLAVVVAYSLVFLPDSIEALKGDVVAALTYTSNWWQIIAKRSYTVQSGRPEMLKHLWSLAIEEQFYLCWPPLLLLGLRKLGRSRMLVVMAATVAGSTVLLAITSLVSVTFAYYATFTRLSGLLLGGLMAFFFAPHNIREQAGTGARIALDLAGAFGLFVLIAAFWAYSYPKFNTGSVDRSVFFGGFLLVDLATLLVIAAVVHPASDVGRVMGWRPLRWIGVRSYSLYLWHFPIFCITRPRVDFAHFFHLHGWPVFGLRFGLSFAAAEVSYRFIESPIRNGAIGRYRNRLKSAEGARRQVLLRRGAVFGGALLMVAILLCAGLASASPQPERFGDAQNGAIADPSALAALTGGSEGSSAAATTSTTVHGTRRPVTPATTPTPPKRVLAIGDSVMLGAKPSLEATIPGIVVDAVKSRQFGEAVALVNFYLAAGVLPPVLVIHLGTNGRVTDGAIDQIMGQAGAKRKVYFLTARVPRLWETDVNDTLHRAATRWKNLKVLEWRDVAGCQDSWFTNDGFHLQPPGQRGYASFVLGGIEGHPATQCKK